MLSTLWKRVLCILLEHISSCPFLQKTMGRVDIPVILVCQYDTHSHAFPLSYLYHSIAYAGGSQLFSFHTDGTLLGCLGIVC